MILIENIYPVKVLTPKLKVLLSLISFRFKSKVFARHFLRVHLVVKFYLITNIFS